ncbi:MAG: hypothetical protein QME79_00090 [Bacillota bacterium]|nr:hypothetical protein [Bacillota bacterium]
MRERSSAPPGRPGWRRLAALLALGLALAGQGTPTAASGRPLSVRGGAPEGRQAVLLVVDGVGLKDLAAADLPNFRRLLVRRGALAAANVRPAGPYLPESGYVSLGAGTRAYGSPTAGLLLGVDEPYEGEPAGVVFQRNTGYPAPPGSLVNLDLPHLLTANAGADHPVVVGALGQALREAGKRAVLLGHADTPREPSRLAGCVTMDARGTVPSGNVGTELARPDPHFPTGRRTDYHRLLEEFRRFYPQADLVVVETGDTSRLNRYADWLTAEQDARMRRRALRWFDTFLGEVARTVAWDRTLLVVAVPAPSPSAVARGELLTFVAAFGPDIRPGLLSSPTTRRPGLVTGADVAPTILAWLGVPIPPSMTGRPLTSQPFANPLPALLAFERTAVATYAERPPLLRGYVILQIIFILSSLAALFLAPRLPRGASTVLRLGLVSLTAVPLALLLLPWVQTGALDRDVLCLIGLTAVLVLMARFLGRSLSRTFVLVYLATALAILVDLVLGARLGRASLLGYDPLGGARYYGLGNEYMGVVIGAAVTGCTALLDLHPALRPHWRCLVLVPLGLGALLTGLSGFGANFGGFLGGVATLLVAWLAFREQRFQAKTLGLLAAVGGGLVAAVVAADTLRPSAGTSHVGLLVRQIAAGGPGALYAVAARKLAMNFRLMRYTPWADGLVTFIIGLGVLFYRPVGLLKQIVQANPSFARGFWAALAGTAVVFFVNDSGVVAAATLMLYPTAFLLDLALQTAFASPGDN